MTIATYSAVLDHSVEAVWSLIRDFNNYPAYIDGVTESVIENDLRGDEVGAIRRFLYRGNWTRQRLERHCDEQHSLTYAGIDPLTFPAGVLPEALSPARYQGTIHLQRIVDGERTFIAWSVTLDAAPEQADGWRNLLLSLLPGWTDSLRAALVRNGP
jgi:hypothetical protein